MKYLRKTPFLIAFYLLVSSTSFEILGTSDEFWDALGERESRNDYGCVNDLGFLGRFQMGEAKLHELGYYNDDSGYYTAPGCKKTRNTWEGRWTEKDGIKSIDHFLGIKNGGISRSRLEKAERVQKKAIKKSFKRNREKILEALDGNLDNLVPEVTESGILAAAHLVGPYAVIRRAQNGTWSNGENADEHGTPADEYMTRFSGYDLTDL